MTNILSTIKRAIITRIGSLKELLSVFNVSQFKINVCTMFLFTFL